MSELSLKLASRTRATSPSVSRVCPPPARSASATDQRMSWSSASRCGWRKRSSAMVSSRSGASAVAGQEQGGVWQRQRQRRGLERL